MGMKQKFNPMSGNFDLVDEASSLSNPVTIAQGGSGKTNASDARDAWGLGTMSVEAALDYLSKAGNLAGLASKAASRTNLDLKGMAIQAPDAIAATGGTIADVVVSGAAWTAGNSWYVHKGGNDANGGRSIVDAFLTIQAAITAGSTGDIIHVVDAQPYTEDLTDPVGINILAPAATLINASATHAFFAPAGGSTTYKFRRIEVPAGIDSIDPTSGVMGTVTVDADDITIGAGSSLFDCTSATTITNWKAGTVWLTATGASITKSDWSSIMVLGVAGALNTNPSGAIVFFPIAGGTIAGTVGIIAPVAAGGTATLVSNASGSPTLDLVVGQLDVDALSNITTSAIVSITAGYNKPVTTPDSGAGRVGIIAANYEPVETFTNNVTLALGHTGVMLDGTSNTVDAALPNVTTVKGKTFRIKCVNESNQCSYTPAGTDEVDGVNAQVNLGLNQSHDVTSDGVTWSIN